MAELLTDAERAALPTRLPGWRWTADRDAAVRDAIVRDWRFRDFSAAWGFLCRVALLAERADHHPDWSNSYGRVSITLTTHDAGGVTARDVMLAEAIDALQAGTA